MDIDKLWADLVEANPELAAVEPPKGDADCPKGELCPSHYRVDAEEYQEDNAYGQFVTYVGDWCVVTGDNPELDVALDETPIQSILDPEEPLTLPPGYISVVIRVGEGTLSETDELPTEEYHMAVRFVSKFDDFEDFRDVHAAMVALASLKNSK